MVGKLGLEIESGPFICQIPHSSVVLGGACTIKVRDKWDLLFIEKVVI